MSPTGVDREHVHAHHVLHHFSGPAQGTQLAILIHIVINKVVLMDVTILHDEGPVNVETEKGRKNETLIQ